MAQAEFCGVCGGKGYNPCPICNGKGKIKKDAPPTPSGTNFIMIGKVEVECEACQGTGRLLCKPCNGAGKILNDKPGSKGPSIW